MKFFKKLASLFMALVMAFGIIPLAKCTEVAGGADETKKAAQKQPKVSVLIPVYKVEPYLRQCLDSVVNQTLKDIEIICVDDGSPDNCGKILDEYAAKDKRIRVIHQENKGLPMARQAGLDVATGEYIKFVDSDDYIDLRTLEICYNEAKKDDVDILVHGYYFFNYSRVWSGHNVTLSVSRSQRCFLDGGFGWMNFFKKSLLDETAVSFRGVRNMCEDRCFFMRLYPHAKCIKTIPDRLYYYRQHANSLCKSTHAVRWASDHVNNIAVVYKHWYRQGYFAQAKAKMSFLSWSLECHHWPKDSKINKMFYDTLNSLDANLIRDKRVISRLSKRNKAKLAAIMRFAEPANKKQVVPNKRQARRQARRR